MEGQLIVLWENKNEIRFKNGNTTGFQLLSYAGLLQSVTMYLGNTVE